MGLARDFTDTSNSECFLASVIVNGKEPGQRKEEHIKYIPEAFRKLLFLNWFTNKNKHFIVFERKDIPIFHNSLRPLILFPAEKNMY